LEKAGQNLSFLENPTLALICLFNLVFDPYRQQRAFEFNNLIKTIIKYYLDDYFGILVQMEVIDLEF
jgi:hypothetical protein